MFDYEDFASSYIATNIYSVPSKSPISVVTYRYGVNEKRD
jgi:hypothetical protein